MGWAKLALALMLEALYPSRANCMGCGSPAGADVEWLCADCARLVRPVADFPGLHCPRCGRPLAAGRGPRACPTCGDWPEGVLSAARFTYPYRRPVSGMIRRMKYGGVARMADWMARAMEQTVRRELPPGAVDAVVPVPMHPARLRVRGVNQAAVLARALAGRLGVPAVEALRRTRDAAQQARLTGAARRLNLDGAFAASADVRGRRLLLVDDVLTTGATALACARALRAAGAADVWFIALAGSVDRAPRRKK